MVMREMPPPPLHESISPLLLLSPTQIFLVRAYDEGLFWKVHIPNSEAWYRNLGMTISYFRDPYIRIDDLSSTYPSLKKTQVSHAIHHTLNVLWDAHADTDTPQKLTKEQVVTLDKEPQRELLYVLDVYAQAYDLAQQRFDLREIYEQLQLSSINRHTYNQLLARFNVGFPSVDNSHHSSPKRFAQRAQEIIDEENDEMLQIHLDNITIGFFRRFSTGDDPLLMTLKSLSTPTVPIHNRNVPEIYEYLRGKIPIRKIEHMKTAEKAGRNYYAIIAKQKERARALIEEWKSSQK